MRLLEYITSNFYKTDSYKIVPLTENIGNNYIEVSQDDNILSYKNLESINSGKKFGNIDLEKGINSQNLYKLINRYTRLKNNLKPEALSNVNIILPHKDSTSKIIYNKKHTKIYVKNNKAYKYYKPKRAIQQQILLINTLMDNLHENICVPINYYKIDINNEINLVEEIEYCSFDLFYAIEHDLIRFKNIYNYTFQLASAIHHLHSICKLAHRDLKPENILIKGENGNYKLKLTDFEFSCELDNKSSFQGGTLSYAAPEVFYSPLNDWGKIDMWALGVILYILIFKSFPWKSVNEKDEYYIDFNTSPNKKEFFSRKFGYNRYDIPQEYKIFVKILYYCLKTNPHERINSSQLIQLLDSYD
jgi:serine/threonine protein kinase